MDLLVSYSSVVFLTNFYFFLMDLLVSK